MALLAKRLLRTGAPGQNLPNEPLQLLNVQSVLSGGSVTISWQTNKPADTSVALYFGPAKGCTWNWQLSGTLDQSALSQVYDFDGFAGLASDVASLHANGVYCVAYFGGGDWESYRPDAADFPPAILGNTLSGWPDEKWIDIRALDVLYPIMGARADIAKNKGFDAIEWDVMDGYQNDTGFPLTQADQHAFAKMMATIAHERGMGVLLKNCPNDVAALHPYFEANLVEEAYRYSEQASYMAFSNANKAVLVCEYRDQDVVVANQTDAASRGFSLIRHNLNLNSKYVNSFVPMPPPPAVVLTDTMSPRHIATLSTSHSQTFTGLTLGQRYGFLVWSAVGAEKVYDATPRDFTAV